MLTTLALATTVFANPVTGISPLLTVPADDGTTVSVTSLQNDETDRDQLMITKYDQRGHEQWTHLLSEPIYDDQVSLSVDGRGRVVLSARFHGTLKLEDREYQSLPDGSVVLVALDKQGGLRWTRAVTTLPTNGMLTVVLDDGSWGHVYIDLQRVDLVAPFREFRLAPGQHTVQIENPYTGLSHRESFDIRPGQHVRIRARHDQ